METPNPDHTIAIQEALFAGNKIQAIKLHREQTGMGLKESKDAVEKLEVELRTLSPDRFQKAQGKGCFVLLVALVTASAAIGWLIHRSV